MRSVILKRPIMANAAVLYKVVGGFIPGIEWVGEGGIVKFKG